MSKAESIDSQSFGDLLGRLLSFFRFPARETDAGMAKLFWLVKLRWMAVGGFFILAFPGLALGFLDRRNLFVYTGFLGILCLFNLVTPLVWSDRKQQVNEAILGFQLAFDLVILTSLLWISGGFGNPFVVLFFLHAALGGILVPGRLAWPFVLLLHTLLAALQFQTWMRHDVALDRGDFIATIIVYHAMALIFWIVMRSLGSYLESRWSREIQERLRFEKQDRLRAIGSLAAGFSHEFASPLNAAKIRLERLLRSGLDASGKSGAREDAKEALAALHACTEVVKQMNSSQMDAREFRRKRIPLVDLVQDVVESWREENPESQVEMHADPVGEVEVAPVNFAQVILNLLDNARDADPTGKIRVELQREKARLTFAVCDGGEGFSALVLAHFGEPFVTTKPGGTGLGLYVSQLFAQSLGGDLEISNPEDGGARVSLSWVEAERADA